MSTTLPRHLVDHVHGDSWFHTNNTVKGIKALEHRRRRLLESGLFFSKENAMEQHFIIQYHFLGILPGKDIIPFVH